MDTHSRRRKYLNLLPSREYMKLFAWTFFVICLTLTGIGVVLGRRFGFDVTVLGVGAILIMLVIAFMGVLLAGIVLHLMDMLDTTDQDDSEP